MVSINMVTAFIEHTHVLLEIERERERLLQISCIEKENNIT